LKKQSEKLHWLPEWSSLSISANEEMTAVVKMASPQLHEYGVNEKMNEPEGVLLFQAQIIKLVKFMGADWDKEMAKEAAKLAYQEANWMTVAEVKFFINRIMFGKYESHKNFTPAIFMQFLNSFINETLATRGAVNSYAWREKKASEELFQLPDNPATGEPGKPVDPDVMKNMLGNLAEHFRQMEQIRRDEDKRIRHGQWQALKHQRDLQIVELIERDASQGIAPDKHMAKLYFEALDRIVKNNS
jgi:hypothetical protein